MAQFQNGSVTVLVGADVASRGIHVDDVAHVVNYELPQLAEDLIHRVGRTGRIGATGTASVFVAHQDSSEFRAIERTLGLSIERIRVDVDLDIEKRSDAVLVRGTPVPVMPGSKMVRLA